MNSLFVALTTVAVIASFSLTPSFSTQTSKKSNEPEMIEGETTLTAILQKGNDEWSEESLGTIMGKVGLELQDVPYVANTLESDDGSEVCRANLAGLDCVTFFESVLAMSEMIKAGENDPSHILTYLTYFRYRDGKLTDYSSRLHYLSDWFADNEKKGVVKVITAELPGAEKMNKTINFMSTHTDAYKALKGNRDMIARITEAEKRLNGSGLYYIPKENIAAAEASLQTGDIIGITTTIAGLDVSHSGLCYRDEKGVLRLLHASLTKKQVVLDTRLSFYLAQNSKQTGIIVARPVDAPLSLKSDETSQ